MKQHQILKAIASGLVATGVMTAVTVLAPMMGMPEMNIPAMLAGFMKVPIAVGWIAHFMIGTILALSYARVFSRLLSGSGWRRGALFSLIPWIMAQIVINPMMGAGIFAVNTGAPFMMVLGSLIGHVAYGCVLGSLFHAGEREVAVVSHA